MRRTLASTRCSRDALRSLETTSDAVRASSSVLPPGAAQRSATTAPAGNAAYCVTSVDATSCMKKSPFWKAPSSVSEPGPTRRRLSRESGASATPTPAASRIASSCSRTTL